MENASDVVAERQVLATTLAAPDESERLFTALPPDTWTDWRYAELAILVRRFYEHSWPIDPQSLASAIKDQIQYQQVDAISRVLIDLSVDAPPLTSLPLYIDRVRSLAALRRAHDAAVRFAQRLEHIARNREEISYGDALEDFRRTTDEVEGAIGTDSSEPPMSLEELLSSTVSHDWIVPGLLERTDRLVITGHEGKGKSEIVAQMATTIAAGLHPFSGEPLPEAEGGYRVLVVDAENSKGQLVRRYRRISRLVDGLRERHGLPAVEWKKFAQRMVLRPEGVELTNAREVARVSKAIEQTNPDVLVIGPLYKLTDTDVTDAQGAKSLVSAIDRLRVKYRCAVISEAHAGYATGGGGTRGVRPFGSSIFLRWPEFGYGLQAAEGYEHDEQPEAVDLVAWRGQREERNWPTRLRRGSGPLPWWPDTHTYFDRETEFKRRVDT